MVIYLFKKLVLSRRAGNLVRFIARLSMISIAVSVFAFLIVLFVMNGMNKSIETRIVSIEPHITIIPNDIKSIKNLEQSDLYKYIQKVGFHRYSVFDTQDVVVRTMEGQFRGAIAQGFSKESFQNLSEQLKNLSEQRHSKSDAVVDQQIWQETDIPELNEVFIGVDLARTLGVFEGDYLMILPPESLLLTAGESIKFEKVKIRRIISTNLADLDSQYIFYRRDLSLNTLKNSLSRKIGIEIWLEQAFDSGRIKEFLNDWMDDNKQANRWQIETWIDRNSALFYALRLEKIMIGLFLGLAGLVASFSILTVLALLISQKKRDIAMLRTLGVSQAKAIRYFVQIGVVLSSAGVLSGGVLALVVGYYIQYNPINVLPDIYYDSTIPAQVRLPLFFAVIVVSILIAFLGSYLPARIIEKITPAHVLRMKN